MLTLKETLNWEVNMFDEIVKETIILEGVYSNDPNDTGGETVFGVSRNNFPNWEGWEIVDKYKSKLSGADLWNTLKRDTTLCELVNKFYKTNFWDPFDLDSITDYSLAFKVFDQAVNLGKSRTATHIQSVFNALNFEYKFGCDLLIDGKVGPMTRDKFKEMANNPRYTDVFFKGMDGLQAAHYIQLGLHTHSKSDYRKYMRGWLINRVGKTWGNKT